MGVTKAALKDSEAESLMWSSFLIRRLGGEKKANSLRRVPGGFVKANFRHQPVRAEQERAA